MTDLSTSMLENPLLIPLKETIEQYGKEVERQVDAVTSKDFPAINKYINDTLLFKRQNIGERIDELIESRRESAQTRIDGLEYGPDSQAEADYDLAHIKSIADFKTIEALQELKWFAEQDSFEQRISNFSEQTSSQNLCNALHDILKTIRDNRIHEQVKEVMNMSAMGKTISDVTNNIINDPNAAVHQAVEKNGEDIRTGIKTYVENLLNSENVQVAIRAAQQEVFQTYDSNNTNA